jgi:myo-inositol-1-phosphate synthase
MSIRVAITGVGNCASALIQGVEYYRDAEDIEEVPGVMHVRFGDYHIRDIEFVAAFDVNGLKIGKDISEAIWADPNCCAKFADVPRTGVKVLSGPISDGVAPHMFCPFHVDKDQEPVDVADVLREAEADALVNYLPVGSAEGTRIYAQAALDAGCAFVNCIPEFVASNDQWA